MTHRWGSKNTRKFINLLKQNPCLWDTTMTEYKYKEPRAMAYNAIRLGMKMPELTVQDVKNKIKNLRSTYHQEQKKVTKFLEEEGRHHVPRLAWFDEFAEIVKGVPSELTRSIKLDVDEDSDANEEAETEFLEQQEEAEEVEEEETHNENLYEVMIDERGPPRKRSRRLQAEADSMMQVQNSFQEYEDEFQMFGRSVAAQLKQMPLKYALRLQLKIQSLLTEERIRLQEDEEII